MLEQAVLLSTVKMLLVDDDPDFASLFPLSLRAEDSISFEIENADTLEAALRALGEKEFDMVLLDLGLPDSQGIQTFDHLVHAHPEVAYVVLSGTDDASLALEAVR